MTREQLAHILRAAATIVEDGEILIIGSQAILASYDDSVLPEEATLSIEADVAYLDDNATLDKADEVDGKIGELSQFHKEFGIYAQGVAVSLAQLPAGWRDRVVTYTYGDIGKADARCLEAHDLVISKLAASREKDMTFAAALVREGLVSVGTLRERARVTDPDCGRSVLMRQINAIAHLEPGFDARPTGPSLEL